jgi:hypothetical protein
MMHGVVHHRMSGGHRWLAGTAAGSMSNTLAIASVTGRMRHVLRESLRGTEPGAVGGADVTMVGPHRLMRRNGTHDILAGFDLYLYQVSPSRTQDLRGEPAQAMTDSQARIPWRHSICTTSSLPMAMTPPWNRSDSSPEPHHRRLMRSRTSRAAPATPLLLSLGYTATVVLL